MPVPVEQIMQLHRDRRNTLQPVHAKMRELQRAVNGDLDLPLPELDRNERPMVANLIEQGLTQNAMRVASTMPDCRFPAMKPGIKVSEQRARDRRLAVLSWWEQNDLNLEQRFRARTLLGYGMAPVIIIPDKKRQIPRWKRMDPLTTFWAPDSGMTPDDIIFSFTQTLRWLRANYPAQVARLSQGPKASPDDRFTILHYHDADESVLLALGRTDAGGVEGWPAGETWPAQNGAPYVTLEQAGSRIGMCPAVIPHRITLDRLSGQFDGAVPLFYNQALLMALEVIAVKRGIFPDEWIISRQNETAQIVSEADGLRGERGLITGGDIKPMSLQPGQQTYPTMDRIERALRLAGGIPAELGGESPSNIRTGKRGAQVLSSAIDYTIQEAQEILAASLEEENRRAIAIAKAYFKGKRSFWVTWNGKSAWTEYDTDETFETDRNTVRYAIAGASPNELAIGAGQRIGMGSMSKETWMAMDPLIEDPELELRRIRVEGYRTALMQGVQTQASQGAIPPADVARMIQLAHQGLSDEDALIQVQKEAQERQASAGPVGAPDGPVMPGSPEAMPGLAQPGAGAEAPVAAIQGPNPSQEGLSQLLGALRRPAMQIRQEVA